MNFQVKIDASAPALPGRETFVLRRGGVRRTLRIHGYDDVYAVPGLYEHVVQDQSEQDQSERSNTPRPGT